LRRLDGFIAARQTLAAAYDEAFAALDTVETPLRHADRNHVYHLYALRLRLDKLKIDRAEFIEKLKLLNIGASVHFIPVHLHPYYREELRYRRGDLPQAEAAYECAVSLPLYPRMTMQDTQDVINAVRQITSLYRRA